MRAILLVGLLAVTALAGCSSAPTTHVCATGPKAGQTIDLSTVPGSDVEGFDPETACPPHVAPAMFFSKIPKNITAYKPFTLEWKVTNGTYAHGHAMLSVVKSSPTAVSGVPTLNSYGTELAKKEHQEVPQTFTSASLVFTEPGMRHLRIFSSVKGDGLQETLFWSDEVMLTIEPVQPTGTTVTVTQAVGEMQGAFGAPSGTAQLGDQLVFKNSDLRAHKFTITSAPAGFTKPAGVDVAQGASSSPILLNVPGPYKLSVDTLPQPKTFDINVASPA